MKRSLLLLPICLILISCIDNSEVIDSPVIEVSSSIYTHTDEDIIDKLGEVTNLQRFEDFVLNVNAKQNDKIRIVSYTTEGGQILKDLIFDGNNIMYTIDTTRDQYREQLVAATACQSIEKIESSELTVYKINKCEEELDNYLLVVKNYNANL